MISGLVDLVIRDGYVGDPMRLTPEQWQLLLTYPLHNVEMEDFTKEQETTFRPYDLVQDALDGHGSEEPLEALKRLGLKVRAASKDKVVMEDITYSGRAYIVYRYVGPYGNLIACRSWDLTKYRTMSACWAKADSKELYRVYSRPPSLAVHCSLIHSFEYLVRPVLEVKKIVVAGAVMWEV